MPAPETSPPLFDVAVVGGGLVGTAIAWGLARQGQRVAVLDEGDVAIRPSRGNFALVWLQSKGLGMPAYAAWTKHSTDLWTGLAAELRQETGIDVAYERRGGFQLALSEAELAARAAVQRRLHSQPDMVVYPYEMLDHDAVARLLPAIGPEVAGGSYCPLDGHCNSLRLLRALHTGMQRRGARYLPEHRVEHIDPQAGGFRLRHQKGELHAGKLVLASGIGNARLAPMVGLAAPVRPQRGQILVTERLRPFLPYPVATIRQTDDGTVLLGDSQEEAGLDDNVGSEVTAVISDRAVRMFPRLAQANVVRSWAALRVMTPDGFPVYDHSQAAPGAFLATCHSGVTLAASHALALAPMLAAGSLTAQMRAFSARRFDVPTTA